MMQEFPDCITSLYQEVQNYEESYREAKIKYDNGALASLAFVIYKTNKNIAELNLIAAKYAYLLANKDPRLLPGPVDLVNPGHSPPTPRARASALTLSSATLPAEWLFFRPPP